MFKLNHKYKLVDNKSFTEDYHGTNAKIVNLIGNKPFKVIAISDDSTVEAISIDNTIFANDALDIDFPAVIIDDFCIFNTEFKFFEEVSSDTNENITVSFEVENADQARWAIKTLKSTFGV